MSTAFTLFSARTLTLATALVLYVASLRLVAREHSRFPPVAAVPFLTPVHTWRLGARALSVSLALAILFYALLWLSVMAGEA